MSKIKQSIPVPAGTQFSGTIVNCYTVNKSKTPEQWESYFATMFAVPDYVCRHIGNKVFVINCNYSFGQQLHDLIHQGMFQD